MVTEVLLESGECCWSSTTFEGWIRTPPPTRATITRIRDKFEVDGKVQVVLKGRCGRKRSSADNDSADAVMQVFAQSPKKSLRRWDFYLGGTLKLHKTTNTGGTEISDWTCYNNIPLAKIETSLLGVYCCRRWTFRKCKGLRKFKECNTTPIVFLSHFVAEK